jgi:hypothetical protein
LNETLPKSEWREGPDGKPRGPWQRQHVLEFVNLEDMQRYSWPTSTIGGSRCVVDLRDRIMLMRRFRGENVYPTVRLTHTFMPTDFGGRERRTLKSKSWIKIGAGETEALPPQQQQPALPATSPSSDAQPVNEPAMKTPTVSEPVVKTPTVSEPTVKVQTVSEPTLEEELQDKLPY